jgi:hypothetical protein
MRPPIAAAVMAKLPVPGQVKTRLVPPLSPEQAAALAAAMLADALAVLRAVADVTPVFAVAGDPAQAASLAGPGIRVLAQRGEGLSERIVHAAHDLLADHEGVLLFGADTLGLTPDDLTNAAGLLALPGDRMVLGPSADGGYWLIGLKAARAELFDGIAWSTATVLAQQLVGCARAGVPVAFVAPRADCDGPQDLCHAARAGGSACRAFLAAYADGVMT